MRKIMREVNSAFKAGRINITARSQSELDMRISELEKRGYTVKHIIPVEYADRQETSYDGNKAGKHRPRQQFNAMASYRAVMVRG
ncbi:MAG: hypothetical protein WED82_00575 [Balneolales bacterium]